MNNQVRKMEPGDRHLISLVTSFVVYFVLPVIMMTALMFAIGIKNKEVLEDINNNGAESIYYIYLVIFAQVISNLPIAIMLVYFTRKILKEDWLKFKSAFGKNIVLIIVASIAILPVTGIVAIIYEELGITGVSNNETLIRSLLKNEYAWLMGIATVFLAPLIEELMFRKFLIGTMEEKFKWSPVVAVIVSSVLFSLVHVTSDIVFIFQYLPLAAVITLAYHYSGNNIYVAIGVHFANNLLATLSSFLLTEVILRVL